MLVSTIVEKSQDLINQAKSLFGIDQLKILIAEETGAYLEEVDCYCDPHCFIIDTGSSIDENLLKDFTQYLAETLGEVGIEVYFKTFLDQATAVEIENDDLFDNYRHLLSTAIDIQELDQDRGWQEQFEDKKFLRSKKQKTDNDPSQSSSEDQITEIEEKFRQACGLNYLELQQVSSNVAPETYDKMVTNIAALVDEITKTRVPTTSPREASLTSSQRTHPIN